MTCASAMLSLESLGVVLLVVGAVVLLLLGRLAVRLWCTYRRGRCFSCSYTLDPSIPAAVCSECGVPLGAPHVRALRRRLCLRGVGLLAAAGVFAVAGAFGVAPAWLRQSPMLDHLLLVGVSRLDFMLFMSRLELLVERRPDVWFATLTDSLKFGSENRGLRLDVIADETIAMGLARAALSQPLPEVADGLLFQAIAYGSVPDDLATRILELRVREIIFEPGHSSATGDAALYERLLNSKIVLHFVGGIGSVHPNGSLGLVIGVRYVELITPSGPIELIKPPIDALIPRGQKVSGEPVPTVGQTLSWRRSRPRDEAQPGNLGPRRESPIPPMELVSKYPFEQLSIRSSIYIYGFGIPKSRRYVGEVVFSAADLIAGVREGTATFTRLK
jgi:hypothetical protein